MCPLAQICIIKKLKPRWQMESLGGLVGRRRLQGQNSLYCLGRRGHSHVNKAYSHPESIKLFYKSQFNLTQLPLGKSTNKETEACGGDGGGRLRQDHRVENCNQDVHTACRVQTPHPPRHPRLLPYVPDRSGTSPCPWTHVAAGRAAWRVGGASKGPRFATGSTLCASPASPV